LAEDIRKGGLPGEGDGGNRKENAKELDKKGLPPLKGSFHRMSAGKKRKGNLLEKAGGGEKRGLLKKSIFDFLFRKSFFL